MRPALLTFFVLAATPGLARAIEGLEDLIVLQNGGRLRGTIVEHEPGGPATIRMPDRSLRVVPADEIAVVRWGDDATELEAPADTARAGAAAPVTESEPADAPAPVRELRTYEEESDPEARAHVYARSERHGTHRGAPSFAQLPTD